MAGTWRLHSKAKVRRWCSGIMQDSHSCDPGSIPGRRTHFLPFPAWIKLVVVEKVYLKKPISKWLSVQAKSIWIQNLNFRWIQTDSAATVDSAGVNGKGYVKERVPAWPNG